MVGYVLVPLGDDVVSSLTLARKFLALFRSLDATSLPVSILGLSRMNSGTWLRMTAPINDLLHIPAWSSRSSQECGPNLGLFERLHGPQEYGGAGLAIAKLIMEKHGGTGSAESSLGKGRTFYLSFPES